MKDPRKLRKGSVILPTLLIIMIIVGTGSTYLALSFNEFKLANRNANLQSSINLAEAGIEEAMLSIRKDDWSDWTTVTTDHYYRVFPHIGLGSGKQGLIKVYVSVLDSSAPIIFAEGRVLSDYGNIKKQIRLDLTQKGLFANGLTAKEQVTFNGNKIDIDSYNSDNGDYNYSTNRNDKGTVGSLALAFGSVNVGNADIWGYVATGGGQPDVGNQGSIRGNNSPSGSYIDWDRVALDFYADFADISAPNPPSPNTTLPSSGNIGTPSALSPTYYKVSSYSSQSQDTLIIDGPVVIIIDGSMTTKGTIEITSTGSVEFYVAGDVDIGGNGMVNTSNIPSKTMIFGTASTPGSQSIKLAGNGALRAGVYAPNADLNLLGSGSGGEFMGAAVANNITMTGNFDFHYDEALDSYSLDKGYKINRWRELIYSDEKVPLDYPTEMVGYAVSYDTQPVFNQPSNL